MGYLRGRRPDGCPCDQPLLVVCAHGCSAQTWMPCGSVKGKRCASCSSRHRTRLRRIVADTLDRRSETGHAYLLTFTAPGDQPHKRLNFHGTWHPGMHRPICGCDQRLAGGLGVWNASAAKRWNHLRTALRRAFPGMDFFRAVEAQDRGALHLHVVVWVPQRLDHDVVADLALSAGFGCSTKIDEVTSGDVSAYVTKAIAGYVTKSADARDLIPWVDLLTGEVLDEAPYRLWSTSQTWGLTMAAVKHAVRRSAIARASALRDLEAGNPPGQLALLGASAGGAPTPGPEPPQT